MISIKKIWRTITEWNHNYIMGEIQDNCIHDKIFKLIPDTAAIQNVPWICGRCGMQGVKTVFTYEAACEHYKSIGVMKDEI